MPEMTQEELEEFLQRPLVAIFVTSRRDGTPQVSPMWYEYSEGKFFCQVGANAVKARNIRRDPHVALCIANHDEPYKYVVVEGTCEIVHEAVAERTRSISTRYFGKERGEEFAGQVMETGTPVVLEITPTKMLTENEA